LWYRERQRGREYLGRWRRLGRCGRGTGSLLFEQDEFDRTEIPYRVDRCRSVSLQQYREQCSMKSQRNET
jgi:hypothetical protein